MGESYLPHSILHEKVLTLQKTVRASRTPTKGQEQGVVQTHQNPGLARSPIKTRGCELLRTFPTGSTTRLQCGTAFHFTESCEPKVCDVT